MPIRICATMIAVALFASGCGGDGSGGGSAPALELQRNVEQAASFARDEARYITRVEGEGPFARIAALSAMNLVEVEVSAPRFGARRDLDHLPLPTTAEENLRYLAGLCQGNVDAFLAIVRRLGLEGRRINFFWKGGNSHVVAEVRWDGDWHMLDPTWGAYWSASGDRANVLSYEEYKAGAPREMHVNDARVWYSSSMERVDRAKLFNYFNKAEGVYAP